MILGKPVMGVKKEGMERNRTVITLDKFNYHRSSTERSNLSSFFRLLRRLSPSYKKKLRLVGNGLFHPTNPSNVSRDFLSAFREGRSVFERRISRSILDRVFLSYRGDLPLPLPLSLSLSPPRETTVTRLKIGEKSYFHLIFPLRPSGERAA